ncbi:hypothetical protein PQR05_38370 [Paraburkholderia sediminicola]|uniref:Uncharacterized protein n=2 Tax=Paraburkholderia TaxID=1822464 RepID=A0ABW9DL69_9BURK
MSDKAVILTAALRAPQRYFSNHALLPTLSGISSNHTLLLTPNGISSNRPLRLTLSGGSSIGMPLSTLSGNSANYKLPSQPTAASYTKTGVLGDREAQAPLAA